MNKIKIIGIGYSGISVINYLYDLYKQDYENQEYENLMEHYDHITLVSVDTDIEVLKTSKSKIKVQLGDGLTEDIHLIENLLESDLKMVIIVTGMGGVTGTAVAPIIAKVAKKKFIASHVIGSIPFQFEGKVRGENAVQGIKSLYQYTIFVDIINSDNLRNMFGNLGFKAGFKKLDMTIGLVTFIISSGRKIHKFSTLFKNSWGNLIESKISFDTNIQQQESCILIISDFSDENQKKIEEYEEYLKEEEIQTKTIFIKDISLNEIIMITMDSP